MLKSIKNLLKDETGNILVELALVLPMFTVLGFGGIEVTNYTIANTQISQITMNVADNISRAKEQVPIGLPQFREQDVRDTFQGAQLQSKGLDIFASGRMIISSLQTRPGVTPARQWIAWQRCRGVLPVQSTYGVQDTGWTNNSFQGMGAANRRITAQAGEAFITVETIYNYRPVLQNAFFGQQTIRHESTYMVRDDRNLGDVTNIRGIFNPVPQVNPIETC
jgi:Flp pilus assembly protein TadG